MENNMFDNPLSSQCLSLPELAKPQVEGALLGLSQAIPEDVLKKIRRVLITGCGDSYVAAQAAIPAFRKFAGRFGSQFSYARAIDAARFTDFSSLGGENALVIGVSCSGGPARISEVLERANRYGCVSLALTNNPESPAAKTAAYTYLVHTPEFPNANPGLRNYFASLTGLYLLAAKLGELTGCSKPGALEGMAAAIVENTAAWAGEMDRINSQMLVLSEAWKDIERFDYIGDDIQFASAFFMAAKIVEVTGCMTATDDSEDWCHVGFFQRDPHSIGTVVAADRYANDWSRLRETLSQAAGIGRPTLLIVNGTQEGEIPEGVTVCSVPEAPEGYDFLLAMMNYVPGALLAGYLSVRKQEPFFRGGGVWAQAGNNTIRTSKIEIV